MKYDEYLNVGVTPEEDEMFARMSKEEIENYLRAKAERAERRGY